MWYGGVDFGDRLSEDYKIRKYIKARLSKASVSKIVRRLKNITITISTARPGIIIEKEVKKLISLKKS